MKKIIIIGAGIAGLSAGIYARLNGFDTEIYEMHHTPGGECTGWKRRDYYFDGCIHWLVGTKPGTPLNAVWREVGALDASVPIILNDTFYTIDYHGQRINLYRDLDRLEGHLTEVSPADKQLITQFCRSIRALKPMSMPTEKPYDMMNALDMAKMAITMAPFAKHFSKYEKLSIGEFAAQFKSPALRRALTAVIPAQYKATSLAVTLASYANGDSGWPTGGSLALARRMEKKYLDLGGKISYKSRVDKILVENATAKGILLDSGQHHLGDFVISAADGYATIFEMLEGKYLSEQLQELYSNRQAYPTFTSVQVSLGIDGDLSQYPSSLDLALESSINSGGIDHKHLGLKHYCFDKTLMPAGKSVLTAVLHADFEWWKNKYDLGEAYLSEKERIAAEVIAVVKKHYPEAQDKIEVVDVATPMTYHRYCNAWRGAWMSFVTTPQSKIRFIPGKLPGLDRFYLSGQWTLPPGGLPTAVLTGRWTIQRICRAVKQRFKTN